MFGHYIDVPPIYQCRTTDMKHTFTDRFVIHTLQVQCDTYCTGAHVTGLSYCMYLHAQEGHASHIAGSLLLMLAVETERKKITNNSQLNSTTR